MPKRHTKDKLHLSHAELLGSRVQKERPEEDLRPLPFDHCALSMVPWERPVCTADGVLFDAEAIVAYIEEHGRSPVSGEALRVRDLIRLEVSRNAEGACFCPVTYKPFSTTSHIVAVRTGGGEPANVYMWEAVRDLNVRGKNWSDLMNGRPFAKKDIVTLQNPDDEELTRRRDVRHFVHLKQLRERGHGALPTRSGGSTAAGAAAAATRNTNTVVDRIMQRVHTEQAAKQAAEKEAKEAQERERAARERREQERAAQLAYDNAAVPRKLHELGVAIDDITEGRQEADVGRSASLTSTSRSLQTHAAARAATMEEINVARYHHLRRCLARVEPPAARRGTAVLETSVGPLEVELFTDMCPLTCDVWMSLALRRCYDDVSATEVVPASHARMRGDDLVTQRFSVLDFSSSVTETDMLDPRLQFASFGHRGVLAMENRASYCGSEFVLTLGDSFREHGEDGGRLYTIFGRVVEPYSAGGGGDAGSAGLVEEAFARIEEEGSLVVHNVSVGRVPFVEHDASFLELARSRQRARVLEQQRREGQRAGRDQRAATAAAAAAAASVTGAYATAVEEQEQEEGVERHKSVRSAKKAKAKKQKKEKTMRKERKRKHKTRKHRKREEEDASDNNNNSNNNSRSSNCSSRNSDRDGCDRQERKRSRLVAR